MYEDKKGDLHMNLKVNKKAPLLSQGEYQARVISFNEMQDKSKAVIVLGINGQHYNVWLDESREITYKDLQGQIITTTQAQMVFDSIVAQLANNPLLANAQTMDEIIGILLMDTTVLTVYVTVFENRLNNFHFYKPKNFDAKNII